MLKSITLTVDDQGNIVLAGPFTGMINIAGQQLVSSSLSDDIFVAKFEPHGGQLLWTDCLDRATGLNPAGEEAADICELDLDDPELFSPPSAAADADSSDRDSCPPVALSHHEAGSASRRTTGIALGILGAMTAGVVGLMLIHKPEPTRRWAYLAPLVAQESTNAALAAASEARTETAMIYRADEPLVPAASAPRQEIAEQSAGALPDPTLAKIEQQSPSQIAQETLRLLNQREFDKAATWATALVEVTPNDAHAYLCLGAALQELRRVQEAHAIYRACSRYAETGAVWECVALRGR